MAPITAGHLRSGGRPADLKRAPSRLQCSAVGTIATLPTICAHTPNEARVSPFSARLWRHDRQPPTLSDVPLTLVLGEEPYGRMGISSLVMCFSAEPRVGWVREMSLA